MKRIEGNAIANKTMRNIFLIVIGFLALGAVGGGLVLMISPTGELIGLPLSEFNNMPFESFLIPGVILFLYLELFHHY